MNEELSSISRWICELKEGDLEAAQPLWERYFAKLVDVARRKLKGIPRGARDEEDVALSAFDSFCRAAKNGRFPKLHDRDELWRILLAITVRKVIGSKKSIDPDTADARARPPE